MSLRRDASTTKTDHMQRTATDFRRTMHAAKTQRRLRLAAGSDGAATVEFGDLSDLREKVLNMYFSGGENNNRLRDSWIDRRSSANSALEQNLDTLRLHSNELYTSFAHATGAIETQVNNVVGTGLWPEALIKPVPGLITAKQARRYNAEINSVYEQLLPMIGPSGLTSLWELQRLIERCYKRDGEIFVLFSDVGRIDKPIPLQVDLIEVERIENPVGGAKVTMPDGSVVPYKLDLKADRMGIRKTPKGDVVGYFVRDEHPDDVRSTKFSYTFYTPERLKHVFEQLWPNQRRGLPWFFSILNLAKDHGEFNEAVRISAMVAACMTAFLKTNSPSKVKAAVERNGGFLDLEPGKIPVIGLDDEIMPMQSNQPATTLPMFNSEVLHSFAVAIGMPYGWFTRNRNGATYSAGKLDEIDGIIPVSVDQQRIQDRVLVPLHGRVVRESIITGQSSIPPHEFGQRSHLYTRHRWRKPGRPLLDPGKELPAWLDAAERNGIDMEYLHDRLGLDGDDVLRNNARRRRIERRRGILPTRVMQAEGQHAAMTANDNSSGARGTRRAAAEPEDADLEEANA
jgi:lambda family phage portal protein